MKTRLFLAACILLGMSAGANSVWGQSRFSISFNIAPVYTQAASKAILPLSIDPAYST